MFSQLYRGKFYGKYLADPTNPEARDIMQRMDRCRPPAIVAQCRLPIVWTCGILACASLILGFSIPESWWIASGTYDLCGILGFIVLGVLAYGCWWGWIEDLGISYIERRFQQLVKKIKQAQEEADAYAAQALTELPRP